MTFSKTQPLWSFKNQCQYKSPHTLPKLAILARECLGGYSVYFGLEHGADITTCSQIGLPILADTSVTHEQYLDMLCFYSVI